MGKMEAGQQEQEREAEPSEGTRDATRGALTSSETRTKLLLLAYRQK